MAEHPENPVLELLRGLRADAARLKGKLDGKIDALDGKVGALAADFRSGVQSLRADFASDLIANRKELSEQIVGLRRAAFEYHSSAIGHGPLFTELDERVRRIERHLTLPQTPPAAH